MKLTSVVWLASAVNASVAVSRNGNVTFETFRVLRVNADHRVADLKSAFDILSVIELNNNHRYSGDATFDVAVPPEHFETFNALNFTATTLSEDLGADIATEGPLGSYPEDHIRYWGDLQASFANNSGLIQAGLSFEGRLIQGNHFWGSSGRSSKPAVFFNGNVYAREWITSMVVEYLLYRLVTGYDNNTTVQAILDNYDFYLLPIVNPDGFGGDGSSSNPGSETFSGYQPGDAPETAALMDFAQTLAADKGIKLYIDWHSYAQVILLSYGYTCDEYPLNIKRQISLAAETATRISQPLRPENVTNQSTPPPNLATTDLRVLDNTTFDYGPGCLVLYQSSGNGRDYMTEAAGTEFGWGIELRSTSYGFLLPADQILPSGIEIWEGINYLWANM
ncbi:hypothetical protein F5Y06DRAFT_298601 [Hypoxylon sp. FL0890]|nr:hypothetical protein F5Y06DRAFT_298601 [Hypoxylon sp. FL0890]